MKKHASKLLCIVFVILGLQINAWSQTRQYPDLKISITTNIPGTYTPSDYMVYFRYQSGFPVVECRWYRSHNVDIFRDGARDMDPGSNIIVALSGEGELTGFAHDLAVGPGSYHSYGLRYREYSRHVYSCNEYAWSGFKKNSNGIWEPNPASTVEDRDYWYSLGRYSVLISAYTAPIKSPKGITATNKSNFDRITLNWLKGTDIPDGSHFYRIYRGTTSNPAAATLLVQLSGSARTWTDSNVVPNDVYYYWVTTYANSWLNASTNKMEHESPRTSANCFPGSAKTISVLASDGEWTNTVQMKWEDLSSFARAVKIERSIPNSTSRIFLAELPNYTTTYSDDKLIPGFNYTYYITPLHATRTFPAYSDKGYTKPDGIISGTVISSGGTGVDSVRVCARPVTPIPPGAIAVPAQGYCTYTNINGNFEIRNIYYFQESKFTVTPYKSGLIKIHDFTPDSLQRTLDLNAPVGSGMNFTDVSVYTVGGKVLYPDSPAGACGVPGVEIKIDGRTMGIYTNESGNWSYTLPNEGSYKFKPVFKHHRFKDSQGLQESQVFINDDKNNIDFTDIQVDSIQVKVQSGCGTPLATRAMVQLTSPNACYNKGFYTDANGLLTIRDIPARKYTVQVTGLDPMDSNIMDQIGNKPVTVDLTVRDTIEVISTRDSISITPADTVFFPNGSTFITPADTVITSLSDTTREEVIPKADFIYHSPLNVTMDFTEAGAEVVCNNIVLMEQDKTYRLHFNVREKLGNCPVTEGVLRIFDFVSDRGNSAVEIPIKNGTAIYTIRAGFPELKVSTTNNHEKLLWVEPRVGFLKSPFILYWIMVTGTKSQAPSFVTKSPDIPMLILHDPPGDQSYAYVNKGLTVSTFSRHEVMVGGEAGIYSDLTFGSSVGSTKAGLAVKLTLTGGRDNFNRKGILTTVSFDETFSTSDMEELTGHDGDVYIGASLNEEFSLADELTFDKATCTPVLRVKPAVNFTGFNTTFIYTENHIKNTLIPNFRMLIESTLAGRTTHELSESEKRLVVDFKIQIANWEHLLDQNNSNRGVNAKFEKNISFSAGAPYTSEFTSDSVKSSSYEYHQLVNLDFALGGKVENDALFWAETDIGYVAKFRYSNNHDTGTDSTFHRKVGYVLKDGDIGDFFSVDIKKDQVYGVPAFDMKSGTVSCPQELGGQKRDDAEIQIFPPEISYVPVDGAANFVANLTNASQSRETREYAVKVISNTNPEGAMVKLGGTPINNTPVLYNLGFNTTTKIALTVEKGPYADRYDSLGIVMYPPCEEGSAGSDTAWINVNFLSECTPVMLSLPVDGWLVNQTSNNILNVALTGYDFNDVRLKSFTLQCMKEGKNWIDVVTIPKESLTSYFYDYPFDVSGLADGTYRLRVKSSCGSQGITIYSSEKRGIIDRISVAPFGYPSPSDGILREGQEISVSFDKNISCDLSSAFIKMFREDSTEIAITPQCFGNKIILMPQNNLFLQTNLRNDTIMASVSGVRDEFGNIQKYPANWSFILMPKVSGPMDRCPTAGIRCPEKITVASEPGVCGAQVFYPDIKPSLDCSGSWLTLEQTGGLSSGFFFPVGVTTNSFTLTNAEGEKATCSFDVTVYDNEPPVISDLSASLYNVWPPSENTIPVALTYTASDNCEKTDCEIFVMSTDPASATSTRKTPVPIVLIDQHHILLVAGRSGPGEGREYTIFIRCRDKGGFYAQEKTTIFVPHVNTLLKSTGSADQTGLSPDISAFKPEQFDVTTQNEPFMANVWPNPTKNNFNIEVSSLLNEKIVLTVFDVLGRQVSNADVTVARPFTFGDDFEPGVYFVSVRQGEFIRNFKVVKQ